jgi:hypothetical protein
MRWWRRRFIERRLKLQLNAAKSAVAGRGGGRSLALPSGTTGRSGGPVQHRVRELTGRHRGISLERMIGEPVPYLRGWAG